jgi:DNA-binding NarL/FixJ family response regulator
MPKNTAFIVSNHLMFQRGLESLLGRHKEIDLIGRATNPDQAVEELSLLHPDVIIIDSTSTSVGLTSAILRLLGIDSGIKVISVNLHNNQLFIYQHDQQMPSGYNTVEWKVEDITDLIKAINYTSPSSQTAAA